MKSSVLLMKRVSPTILFTSLIFANVTGEQVLVHPCQKLNIDQRSSMQLLLAPAWVNGLYQKYAPFNPDLSSHLAKRYTGFFFSILRILIWLHQCCQPVRINLFLMQSSGLLRMGLYPFGLMELTMPWLQ